MMRIKEGFTLIELLIVIAIIVILTPVMMNLSMISIRRQPLHTAAGFDQIETRFFLQHLAKNYLLAREADLENTSIFLQNYQDTTFRYRLSNEGFLIIEQNNRLIHRVKGIENFEITREDELYRVYISTVQIPDLGHRKKEYSLFLRAGEVQ